jgi:ElaB/YqjD/DUF883 family membrane-anchored ribosome-binding protein
MTEPNLEITAGAAIAIARMEATLDGVKKQIDHQDRNTAQLVKLFEERMMGKFVEIERRLDAMERAREEARMETQKDRSLLDTRLRELERGAETAAEKVAAEAKSEVRGLDGRLKMLEEFRWKLVGVMAGVGMVAGGAGAVVAKGIGGL